MRTIIIPSESTRYTFFINNNVYTYAGGTAQTVPDEVANLIEAMNTFPPPSEEPGDPFTPEGVYVKPKDLNTYAKKSDLSDFEKKEDLKKNFQSQDSMDQLTAVLGTALGGTITKTWDAANKKYTYVFTETPTE